MSHDEKPTPVDMRFERLEVFRKIIDDVAMVTAYRVPKRAGIPLQALPRPAPPQEEPRPWWRRWLR